MMTAKPRIALALLAFNRPALFRLSLRSLLGNAEICDCDLWIFLDGGPDQQQAEHQDIAREELLVSPHSPVHVHFILREENFGCGRNLIDARRFLFDKQLYPLVFIFEDDMIVSAHYIRLCLRMLHWAKANYVDIGVVQAYNGCWLAPDAKMTRRDQVLVSNVHWWGYLMPRETWKMIRYLLYEYECRFLEGRHYSQRPTAVIRSWMRQSLTSGQMSLPQPTAKCFPSRWDYRQYFKDRFPTGQDAVTALALARTGLKKLVTVVNRGLPIGRVGIHCTESQFVARRYDQMRLECLDDDRTLESFRPYCVPE